MHWSMILPFFQWADELWISNFVRGSVLYFPIIETFHLFALTLLFGALIMMNLRLFGLTMKGQPVPQVARELAPWMFWSLILILGTGVLLFASEALRCYGSAAFWMKITFLFSAVIFHFTIYRKKTRSDSPQRKALTDWTLGAVSLVLWFGVALGGRGIGFY